MERRRRERAARKPKPASFRRGKKEKGSLSVEWNKEQRGGEGVLSNLASCSPRPVLRTRSVGGSFLLRCSVLSSNGPGSQAVGIGGWPDHLGSRSDDVDLLGFQLALPRLDRGVKSGARHWRGRRWETKSSGLAPNELSLRLATPQLQQNSERRRCFLGISKQKRTQQCIQQCIQQCMHLSQATHHKLRGQLALRRPKSIHDTQQQYAGLGTQCLRKVSPSSLRNSSSSRPGTPFRP
jgi:hypothetical protein